MMNDKEILALFKDESFCNYCLGRNAEDIKHWEQWLEQHPEDRRQVENQRMMIMLLEHEISSGEIDQQFEILKKRIEGVEPVKKLKSSHPLIVKWSVAASLILVVGLGYYFYSKNQNPLSEFKKSNSVVKQRINKAFLILSDGATIDLADAGNGMIATESGSQIIKYAEGKLIYNQSPGKDSLNAPKYNTLQTPKGGQYKVILTDGTIVYLNAASSLKYPASFKNLSERTIELIGEASFEVKHDARHPFVLKVRDQVIRDLGTSFVVRSYPDELLSKTTLMSGLVSITTTDHSLQKTASVVLKPGQEASVSKKGVLRVAIGDTSVALAWMKADFYFKNADVKSVMNEIARWYDVDVSYQGDVTKDSFTGKIPRLLTVSQVLEKLASSKFIRFRLEGRRIIIFN